MNATTVYQSPVDAFKVFGAHLAKAEEASIALDGVVTQGWAEVILTTAPSIAKVDAEAAVFMGLDGGKASGLLDARVVYSVAVLNRIDRRDVSVLELVKALRKGFSTNADAMGEAVAFYAKTKNPNLSWASIVAKASTLTKKESVPRTQVQLFTTGYKQVLGNVVGATDEQLEALLKAVKAEQARRA